MSCAAGCGFFSLPDSVYCSKHFNELATPEEKAERQRKLDGEKKSLEDAKNVFNSILEGPIEEASIEWVELMAMPGFRDSWVASEISECIRRFDRLAAYQRILRLEEGNDEKVFQYQGLRPVFAYLNGIIGGRGAELSAKEQLLNQILSHRCLCPVDSTEEEREGLLPVEVMNTALYRCFASKQWIEVIRRLLPLCTIDKKLLDAAKFTCKRPANIPTPEKLAIVKLIETTFKERQARDREKDRDTAGDSAGKRARTEAESERELHTGCAGGCRFIQTVGFDCTDTKLNVWNCGAYPVTCRHDPSPSVAVSTTEGEPEGTTVVDHTAHPATTEVETLSSLCAAVTNSLTPWLPTSDEYASLCFTLSAETLRTHCGLTPEALSPAEVIGRLTALPVGKSKKAKGGGRHGVVFLTKAVPVEGVYFHPRWYGGDDDEPAGLGVSDADAEVKAQLETTSAAFRAAMAEGAAPTQMCMYHPEADMWGPIVMLVAPAKNDTATGDSSASTAPKGRGKKSKASINTAANGIIVLLYATNEQTHIEHGSNW